MNIFSKLWTWTTWFGSWFADVSPLEKMPALTLTDWIMGAEEILIHLRKRGIPVRPFFLPDGYGCILFTGLLGTCLVWYEHKRIWATRKQYGVLPSNNLPPSLVLDPTILVYQETIQMYPSFIFCLVTGGLDMPYFSSVGGVIWILGRRGYSHVCYIGLPENRLYRSFSMFGYYVLLYTFARCALRSMLDVE